MKVMRPKPPDPFFIIQNLKARIVRAFFCLFFLFADYFVTPAWLDWSMIQSVDEIKAFQGMIGEDGTGGKIFRGIAACGCHGFKAEGPDLKALLRPQKMEAGYGLPEKTVEITG